MLSVLIGVDSVITDTIKQRGTFCKKNGNICKVRMLTSMIKKNHICKPYVYIYVCESVNECSLDLTVEGWTEKMQVKIYAISIPCDFYNASTNKNNCTCKHYGVYIKDMQ